MFVLFESGTSGMGWVKDFGVKSAFPFRNYEDALRYVEGHLRDYPPDSVFYFINVAEVKQMETKTERHLK